MKWEEYSDHLIKRCKQLEVPYHACFELTPFCNFRCNMCYIRLDKKQATEQGRLLTTKQWISIAEEAKRMGTVSLEITGGEAITRKDFPVLYEKFIKLGYLVNLRSNGYYICGETLNLLKKYKPWRIGITLYGASDITYKKVCGVSNGFSIVSKNILELKKAGLNINLTMTLTKDNENDRETLTKWANSNGLALSIFGGLFTPIRGAKRSIEHLKVHMPDQEYEVPDVTCPLPDKISNRTEYLSPFWMCRGFGAMFCISWDGRMTLCNAFTTIWKDPITLGIQDSYTSLYHDLKELNRPKECKHCNYIEYCVACPTRLISATGYPNQTNDDVCKMARRLYNHVVSYRK